ncbi:hypothetical protein UY3_01942 [Chelonia mydas]|uniref:Uncharacterized protein n=1 Tax=Chelonia mydas TaxID=8469 RepID=M7BSI6_CHEMY|nr:hypothetical protein UY3_01942 [Chelonia mydas]
MLSYSPEDLALSVLDDSVRGIPLSKGLIHSQLTFYVFPPDNAIFDDDPTEADDEKESESEDDIANIYYDNAGAAVTEAEFNELFGELETDLDFEGF